MVTGRRQLERGVDAFLAVDHDRCVRSAVRTNPNDEHHSSFDGWWCHGGTNPDEGRCRSCFEPHRNENPTGSQIVRKRQPLA
jgi:hypothetical protein